MATNTNNNTKRGLWGWLAVIGVFLAAKLKWVLALFKIGKFATLASMFVSLGGYALFFGWKFAFAIVYLIFVHEMGHLIAAKLRNIPTSPAVFIPFLGAAIGIDPKKIKDAETEFFVAYGGPLAGFISIMPAVALYLMTQEPYWGLVIQLGALINLFNLFPVSPLDGGRIVTVLSTKIWLIGLLAMIPVMFLSPDPIIMLIFIFGIFTWWERYKDNARIEILRHEETVRSKWNDALKRIAPDESQDASHAEQDPLQARALKNQIASRLDTINAHLSNESGKAIPIIQETKRNDLKKLRTEKNILQGLFSNVKNYEMAFYENTPLDKDLTNVIRENEKKLAPIRQEINQAKAYYKTSTSTKIRALSLYLGLAIVLALLLVYGMNILEASNIRQ
ncbi:site-2 protease family protein [Barrientosiimonas marina]|uniref:Site-2 protease family protein n=2 Tax=Lentibacillus kimchii TaxID=1542911 RepID=A0ABW2UTM4_9BACI